MNIHEKIEQLSNEGYSFDFGKYINDGYKYFKSQAWIFIGFFIISVFMTIAGSFIPFVGSIASQILSLTFYVGYFVAAQKVKNNTEISLNDFFTGFKSITRIALIQLILMGIALLILIPLLIFLISILFSGFSEIFLNKLDTNQLSVNDLLQLFEADGIILMVVITSILYMTFQILYTFSAANAHFFNLGPWEAMEASRKIIQKKFFHFLGLTCIIAFINLIGLACLIIGLAVTIPLSYTIFYAAYDDIVKLGSTTVESEENLKKY